MRDNSANNTTRIIASALETALNAYLRLDAEHEKLLAGLLGKTAGITLSGIKAEFNGVLSRQYTLYLTVTAGGIRVRDHALKPADVIIETQDLFTLLQLIRSQHFGEKTIIHGDSELARRWQALLRGIDIDWEEHLSRIVGDIAAHQLANTARASLSWGRNTANTLLQNVSEYLQYEHNDLPSRYAIEHFLDAVDTLQSDIERLAARIERLQNTAANIPTSDGVSSRRNTL